ncbi:MAG: AAA family ATPase [Pedococcus sp.]
MGRSAEQAQLLRALDRALAGEPSATLLHGEPGIGKTTLVRDVVSRAEAREIHLLLGHCLRFGAEVTTHLPFTQAFGQWTRGVSRETVERVFPGGLWGQDFPGTRQGLKPEAPNLLFHIADAVDRVVNDGPTLLVIDDLQWADPSSLDVLSYIVAGLRHGQHIAIVLTYRDTELSDGHRLHGWLADILRVDRVSRLPLSRLSASETEQLVTALPGFLSRVALAEDVYARSDGNPYLAELLAREVVDAGGNSSLLLREALLASWHRLNSTARPVTQLLAVAGRPVGFALLQDLAVRRGLTRDAVAAAVTEAVGEGIATIENSGDVWFRHPLLAEVITSTLPPWQLPELHRAFAGVWEVARGVTDAERANHLALHYAAARDAEPAFAWALRAADEAARLHATAEEATHLCTAVDLLTSVPAGSRPPTTELLTRAGRCLIAAGRAGRALECYERALEALDPHDEPLATCRVLMARNFGGWTNMAGKESPSLADFTRALVLTDAFPNSKERIDALADLAYFEVFAGIDAAEGHAKEAVRLAERLGLDDALSWALVVRAQTRWGTGSGVVDAERAWALARGCDDTPLLTRVTINVCNSYGSVGQLAAIASISREVYEHARERGSAQGMSCIGSVAVLPLIHLGEWERARSIIRETLALRLSTRWGAAARWGAAVLRALEGDGDAALAHMSRAKELMPVSEPGAEPVVAEVMLAIELGMPRRALELVESRMSAAMALDHCAADELLQLATRAAADLSEATPAAAELEHSAVSWLERIESLRGKSPRLFQQAVPSDSARPAWGALYLADRARCHRQSHQLVGLWQAAATATDRAGLRFEHARSLYFLGRSLLTEPKGRDEAAEALTRAAAIARELRAAPLATLVEQLTLQAHLPLATPDLEKSLAPVPLDALAGVALTPREAEVLQHVVAGETYAQVARRLFISEKTVSVHVSNVLHKTGTSSRIELAALVLRSKDQLDDRGDSGASSTR